LYEIATPIKIGSQRQRQYSLIKNTNLPIYQSTNQVIMRV